MGWRVPGKAWGFEEEFGMAYSWVLDTMTLTENVRAMMSNCFLWFIFFRFKGIGRVPSQLVHRIVFLITALLLLLLSQFFLPLLILSPSSDLSPAPGSPSLHSPSTSPILYYPSLSLSLPSPPLRVPSGKSKSTTHGALTGL